MSDEELDFEYLYSLYKRKEGKTAGMRKLKRTIRTRQRYEKVLQAILNYNRLIEQEGRDKKFIKLWSTFCNCWEDYENAEDLELVSTQPKGLKIT